MGDFFGGIGRGAVVGAIAGVLAGLIAGLVVAVIRLLKPAQKCPNCEAGLPKSFRSRKSGVRTCKSCGCKVDARGRELKRRRAQVDPSAD